VTSASNNILLNPDDTVGLIVWSAAEIAVTMICIGIPVCRPLYKCWLEKLFGTFRSTRSASGYRKQQQQGKSGGSGQRYGLRTFGGGTMPVPSQWQPDTNDGEPTSDGDSETGTKGGGHKDGCNGTDKDCQKQGALDELALGINGPFNEAVAVGGASWRNGSEEEILAQTSGRRVTRP
jgi:hypothetical protein